MAGWRCADGTLGLAAKSGDRENLGLRLILRGWGAAALLSTYNDGQLIEPARISDENRRAFDRGRARLIAVEIAERDCQSIRRALLRYRRHPQNPEQKFTMLCDASQMRGDGCAEFAMWLLGQGRVLAPLVPDLRRDIILRDSFIGHGRPLTGTAAGTVTPFDLDGVERPLPVLSLLAGDWSRGQVVGQVSVLDPELLRRAIDRAYARAYPVTPRLSSPDAQAARVAAAADRWFARYGRTIPLRIGRTQAVILASAR